MRKEFVGGANTLLNELLFCLNLLNCIKFANFAFIGFDNIIIMCEMCFCRVPQDVVATGGKCRILKWVNGMLQISFGVMDCVGLIFCFQLDSYLCKL